MIIKKEIRERGTTGEKKKDGSKKERESEKKIVKKREGTGRDDTEVTQINSLYSRIMI